MLGQSETMNSILGVAVHKAGSSIFQKILVQFAKEAGLVIEPLSANFTESPRPQALILQDLEASLKPKGVFYGVVRSPHFSHMKRLDELRLIAQVRDPRDCLTSHYYSLVYSHSPPRNPIKRDTFLARRRNAQAMSIDDFVLEAADLFEDRFQHLAALQKKHPGMLVCKYEKMVERTDEWRADLAAFFDMEMTSQLLEKLDRLSSFDVDQEDVTKHKRQVAPGDHARKLKPTTISILNSRFFDLMQTFGYETDVH